MSAKRPKLFAVILVPVCAAGALGFWWWQTQSEGGENSASTVVRVVRRDFASSVLATGAVRPQVGAEVHVGSRSSGKVMQLHANIGDLVEKGQVIAELEKADLEAMVAQRQAELTLARTQLASLKALRPKEVAKADAEVAQCEATVILTRKELERENGLLRHEFTTQLAWDRAQERLAVAEAQVTAARKAREVIRTRYDEDLKQARVEIERANAALEHARVQLSYATITAPIAGVIATISTQEGETVAANLNAPTFVTLIDLNRLQVDAYVDEVDIGKVHPGQRAVFTVDAFPAREFEGKVDAIYPKAVIQENVVNYDVVVEITSKYGGLLRPEMTASVTFFLETRKGVLALPAKAIRRERGRTTVHVLGAGGEPSSRGVKVGWDEGGWIEIVSGLEEGQAVLLAPAPTQTVE